MENVQLKKEIRNLEAVVGQGTTLVSLYVPSNSLARASSLIVEEVSKARNIKLSATRGMVVDALRSIEANLKSRKKLPENGIAIFCGFDQVEGQQVIQVVEPNRAVPQLIYRCGKQFHTEPLSKQLVEESAFGVIVVDGHSATFGSWV
eukprot:TRINITY_DN5753_c0_g1_i3.p1 TRINITY_DN5753_c0_g1~~TRINITY_DN5753_c0_g1_i3.p1  ORF type:complete len:148 (-),score=35.51 TRINITY_DN5753_c0_g1_i3:884-1327(-)